MKDYMFAPGRTGYDRLVRDLYRQRPQTELIVTGQPSSSSPARRRLHRVDQYLSALNFESGIDRPLHKVFIGTHGNDSGWMQIDFDDAEESTTTYEVLENANLTNANHFVTAARGPDTHVHIRGCMIGQSHAAPFLSKLKEVLGNQVPVAAPKHFHVVSSIPGAGYIEFFAYQFQISRTTRFTGSNARADLIQAFKDANFSYKGSLGQVQDTAWEIWVPRNISLGRRRIRQRLSINPAILPQRGNPITTLRANIGDSFRAQRQRYRFTVTDVTTDPGGQAARISAVHDAIRTHEDFLAGHDFPIFKRYEFNTVDDFLNAYSWRVVYRANRNELLAIGTRYLYTCMIAITSDPDPSDNTKNHLIFNFNPLPTNSNPPITLISESDTEFFTIV